METRPIPSSPVHVVCFATPEFQGPRPLLSFVLSVLAGQDRQMVLHHLKIYLFNDFKHRTPEEDQTDEMCAALDIMDDHPEVLGYAADQMIATMRELADRWIDSGKDRANPGWDSPAERNTEDVLPQYGTSIVQLMNAGLFDRFPRRMGMRRDGTQGSITKGEPHFERGDLENPILDSALRESPIMLETRGLPEYHSVSLLVRLITALKALACRWAMYWFAALLDSSDSRRIARCDHCKQYFAYERARLRAVKAGVWCPSCKGNASAIRTRASRERRDATLFDTAAKAWIKWESKTTWADKRDWVWEAVNKAHGTAFGRRWVTQHRKEIQERVEALRNAKRQGQGS